VVSLNSALSSLASSTLGREVTAAIPAAIAVSLAGANPAVATAVSAAAAAGSTSVFSALGQELASGVHSVISNAGDGMGSVLSGMEDVVSTVAAPVVYGLGALINVMA
jgi:hypothetical protein